ncbi:Receptor-type tyrosine-protein phosphatase epsilon [Amphibalanus amphitrite]|uniref:protein-tyrosine-phosphatase n=1 Tax=Amphibalanus amphitrite TaxID=1232801 RepID=A0A6A4VNM1_AMPAM|nr:Receptor-type tyrosine-protein phosphatase epsilon [Amphibalanus amphitrite]
MTSHHPCVRSHVKWPWFRDPPVIHTAGFTSITIRHRRWTRRYDNGYGNGTLLTYIGQIREADGERPWSSDATVRDDSLAAPNSVDGILTNELTDTSVTFTLEFTGLTPFTDYTLTVFAVSRKVSSPPHSEVFQTLQGEPGIPANVTGVGVAPTSLTIGWDPPVPPLSRIASYTVCWNGCYFYTKMSVSADEACPFEDVSRPRCRAKVTGLREDTEYSVTTMLNVSWLEPEEKNGRLLQFRLNVSAAEPGSGRRLRRAAGARTFTLPARQRDGRQLNDDTPYSRLVEGLSPGTAYRLEVAASTSAGFGSWASLVVYTLVAAPTVREQPRVVPERTTDTTVQLVLPAAESGGGPLSSYLVLVATAEGFDAVQVVPSALPNAEESEKDELGYYVTAALEPERVQRDSTFVVGDGRYYNSTETPYLNRPLTTGDKYWFGVAVISRIDDDNEQLAFQQIGESIVVLRPPDDESRVVLEKVPGDDFSDYINANFVEGPKKETKYDFWRMVWQEKVARIVMVTNLVEGGKRKCDEYWPTERRLRLPGMKVSLEMVQEYSDFIVRTFSINHGNLNRVVTQFHYTAWPDHSVPLYPSSLAKFIRTVNGVNDQAAPTVVHCSAGVGRTGTVILIDSMYQMGQREQAVDVASHLAVIRQQRANLCANLAQYQLVHQVLVELLVSPSMAVPAAQLAARLPQLRAPGPAGGPSQVEQQLSYLEQHRPVATHFSLGGLQLEGKNRSPDVLPDDSSRVFLDPKIKDNYINAVFVQGYKRQDAFIATEAPLPARKYVFWQMVVQKRSRILVVMNDLEEEDMTETIDVTVLVLAGAEEGGARRRPSLPRAAELLQLYSAYMRSAAPLGALPAVVVCRNGVSGCGLFLTVCFELEHLSEEQELDVAMAVSVVRRSRPQFITGLVSVMSSSLGNA